jgi:hypothetical protein
MFCGRAFVVIRRLLLMGLAALVPAGVWAGDAVSPSLLDVGYNHMYNLEFDKAHEAFRAWEGLHPDDPLGPTSEAAADLFSEFNRLRILQTELFLDDDSFWGRQKPTPDPTLNQRFEGELTQAEELADGRLTQVPFDTNALFAKILDAGLKGDYTAMIEGRYLTSLRYLKRSRQLAEVLLAHDPANYDVHLAVGVENYLLGLNPAPIRWLLQLYGAETDKQAGIAKLRLTAEHGRYLRPYARVLLAVAALRERDRAQAADLLEGLVREFPQNHLYAEELARIHRLKEAAE